MFTFLVSFSASTSTEVIHSDAFYCQCLLILRNTEQWLSGRFLIERQGPRVCDISHQNTPHLSLTHTVVFACTFKSCVCVLLKIKMNSTLEVIFFWLTCYTVYLQDATMWRCSNVFSDKSAVLSGWFKHDLNVWLTTTSVGTTFFLLIFTVSSIFFGVHLVF